MATVRTIKAKVEQYSGSTLAATYSYNDFLKEVRVERVGENKFFGFGICQKVNIKLTEYKQASTANNFKIYFDSGKGYISNFPAVYVTEVNRDRKTDELSITAYDALLSAKNRFTSEIVLDSYSVLEYAEACAELLGLSGVEVIDVGASETCFNTYYPTGANFEGTETIREALNAIAEITQTIYYIDSNNKLIFKRPDTSSPKEIINGDNYFSINTSSSRRISAITHATELGDNVTASKSYTGTNVIIRNNPFWELRDDIDTLVSNALTAATNFSSVLQFEAEWSGNTNTNIGDFILVQTVLGGNIGASFITNDVIIYNGALTQKTKWKYEATEEVATNPVSIGEALKQTYARVDKANKQIELVVSETTGAIGDTNENLAQLRTDYEQTKQDINISITEIQGKEVTEVTTTTGFKFNKDGLTVSKTNSEMETLITEDGMKVSKSGEEVLVANNEGVRAIDLHATTFLIIGNNSRLEDTPDGRTACFWIGG